MDVLRFTEARIARWMAYSDYCLSSDLSLPQCRTFWIWAGVAGMIVVAGIAAYTARQILGGSESTGQNRKSDAE